jgi:hypothetical protein
LRRKHQEEKESTWAFHFYIFAGEGEAEVPGFCGGHFPGNPWAFLTGKSQFRAKAVSIDLWLYLVWDIAP